MTGLAFIDSLLEFRVISAEVADQLRPRAVESGPLATPALILAFLVRKTIISPEEAATIREQLLPTPTLAPDEDDIGHHAAEGDVFEIVEEASDAVLEPFTENRNESVLDDGENDILELAPLAEFDELPSLTRRLGLKSPCRTMNPRLSGVLESPKATAPSRWI